jgi:hypothetical protein
LNLNNFLGSFLKKGILFLFSTAKNGEKLTLFVPATAGDLCEIYPPLTCGLPGREACPSLQVRSLNQFKD